MRFLRGVAGTAISMPLAFWHNPDDFLDWIAVIAAFLVVALVVAAGMALFVAWIRRARKR